MEWYDRGLWDVFPSPDTARQYLELGSQPLDLTAKLNESAGGFDAGAYGVWDPGHLSKHFACTFEWFEQNDFDILLCSIPQHMRIWEMLKRFYKPEAKLIFQVGNNWPIQTEQVEKWNYLASVKPWEGWASDLDAAPTVFYRQEFEEHLFYRQEWTPEDRISSFVNVLEEKPQDFFTFSILNEWLDINFPRVELRSFGGQNADGSLAGPGAVGAEMLRSMMVMHCKTGGDGYGHVVHSAYCAGSPMILKPSQYQGQLAEELFMEGTYVDFEGDDPFGHLRRLLSDPEQLELQEMSALARESYEQTVNFEDDAANVAEFLTELW
jgi:hypothetical protein